jgi:hypothetical protein
MKISTRKRWISTSAWRGYEQPVYAVCGANNTGTCSDSPCPSDVCNSELRKAGAILRKAGIRYKRTICRSSNVFCAHVYLVVPEGQVQTAKELIQPIIPETRLLYIA